MRHANPVFYPWYCHAIRGHNLFGVEWHQGRKMNPRKLHAAFADGDFFAILSFCQSLMRRFGVLHHTHLRARGVA
jgi:hypothetical protein